MIQNIVSLFTSSSVAPISSTHPIKNIPRVQWNTSSPSEAAVKLSISPEARQALDEYQSERDAEVDNSKTKNKSQSTTTKDTTSKPTKQSDSSTELSPEEERIIKILKQNDQKVRTHESQHVTVAGEYVRSGPVYNYTTGPDGKRYAISGRVSLDVTPVPNNPEATIRKAQIIKRAALAPADPSGADRTVAATATRMETKARAKLRAEEKEIQKIDNNKQPNPKIKAYNRSGLQLGNTVNILF